MNLARALRPPSAPVIAFVGAGGKTTALFALARGLPPPVLVTTTTHLGTWQAALADHHIVLKEATPFPPAESLAGVTLVVGGASGGRFVAPVSEAMEWLREISRRRQIPLLIESDGARGRPIKAPAAHEPVIPEFASLVVVTAGLTGLGKPLSAEWVHRPERFAALTGLKAGAPITPEALARALSHPEGGLKGVPSQARRVALLNQADTANRQAQAASMAQTLLKAYDAVLIASCARGVVHAVHERVAGILLAAGGSKRFGRPKQLLTYRGQPFVRLIAQTALQAGLSPVVVVTGARANEVEAAITGLDVTIVHNPDWREGQASSLRVGLAGITPSSRKGTPGAAIFLMADQPQVDASLLRALVEQHARTLSPVIAPLVHGQRATPVLFDRLTFPTLLTLRGARGGRSIFSSYPPAYIPWHDESLLIDVDTPEDYRRLLRLAGGE